MADVEITITAAGGAYVTLDGQPRPVSYAATVTVPEDEADRLVADGGAVRGDRLPDVEPPEPDEPSTVSDEEVRQAEADRLLLDPDTGDADQEAETFDVDNASPKALQAEAERLGLEITGTGQGGNVLKADLVKALKDHQSA